MSTRPVKKVKATKIRSLPVRADKAGAVKGGGRYITNNDGN